MSRIILLDSTPLGFVIAPHSSKQHEDCFLWLATLLNKGIDVRIPEVCDYEVRRGIIRAATSPKRTLPERTASSKILTSLDEFVSTLGYVPLSTKAMRRAAEVWAETRIQGYPTASDDAFDGDMVLCGQALMLADEGHTVTVATANVKHLTLLVDARKWEDIQE